MAATYQTDDTAGNVPAAPQDNGRAAYTYFVNQGLTPAQAAGIVGNLQGESGQGLDPNAISRGDGRDGSDSIGIGQWNSGRADALRAYAASKGTPWNDLNTQLEFLHSELKGPESAAYAGLTAAQTPEQAGQAMLAFERPKDWNVPGAHPERARYAARAFAAYGPSASTTLAPPSATQPSPQQAPVPPAPAAPIFAGGSPGASVPQPAPFVDPQVQAPPIFFAQRKPIDLSGLRAALARAPIFASSQ
ncbi:phage tail tip lysozyme [Bradyrhizobium uaiense]|uniref:Phage tail lysozyme domain-containing protein n=1 Tax=Bradyrhizobium uaiense TaxID=2594946 RepID=A0A6P1BBG8_9BRAD|nr:phage tail tip lysozyme [Bradyrhizobium uaiense]NEU94822.1 hypothetical protein [Bradyrhizobium uaiense]